MMIQRTSLWRLKHASICNSPVAPIEYDELDDRHPARLFKKHFLEMKEERGGKIPLRKQITPHRLRDLMRWMFMFERLAEDGEDCKFRVRLEGTSVVELTHNDYTGRFLHEFTNQECYPGRFQMLEGVHTTKEPGYARIMVPDPESAEYRADVIAGFFPLLVSDDTQESLICAIVSPAKPELRVLL